MANTYNPFIAAGQAAIAELFSSDAQFYYLSATLSTVDFAIKESIIIGEFVQMAVGLVIFLAGESFESGQVFRQQIHEGFSQTPENSVARVSAFARRYNSIRFIASSDIC